MKAFTVKIFAIALVAAAEALTATLAIAAEETSNGYIKSAGNRWTLGTAGVERVVALENGKLLLKSLKNKLSGRELAPGTAAEFFLCLGEGKQLVTSATGPWKLVGAKQTKLKQGERQLDLTVQREALVVTKSYVIYPGSSVIRQWITVKNAGDRPLVIVEPGFLSETIRPGDPSALDFLWMSGGQNEQNSWKLKTETLNAQRPRTFDSYEPFPYEESPRHKLPGDGINAKILLNDRQVWPGKGWQYVPDATVQIPFDFKVAVNAGDRLVFLINMNRNIGYDTTAFNPAIACEGGESHMAAKEFGKEQGGNGWRYQYVENGRFIDLVYYPGPNQWRKKIDNPTGTPFVGVGNQHPDKGQDAARVWTASKSGQVRVTGSVCNTGNGQGVDRGYHHRPGTASYAPWIGLFSKDSKDGLFIGWDYFGHWASSFALGADGAVTAQLKVAGYKQTLAPGESVATPKAFVGLFRNDLDEAGNELLDWQYRYLWDYTRDQWFPAIRMLGYWMKGTGWGQPGVGWLGGNPDMASTFRKVFRVADLMRYCGADVYHRDWGWWDRAGDWNGPDFRTTGNYLRKSGMGQLIYAFLYTVDPESKFANANPDCRIGGTLDMSRPKVVEHMKRQLAELYDRWGDFEWRNDSFFTAPLGGDDTPLLGQDAGLRKVIRDFLEKHPACAFQAVNGGGNYGGYDYTRYCSSFSFSDGAVSILRNYHASLLFPPDKTSDIPDRWNPNDYDKATWRGLLCINFDMTGDTWDLAKLEGIRELIDIYHYLHKQGVVGRWVKVYRPAIVGDPDPTMYFQRLSGDRLRGIIIPKRPAPGPVTIKPKGLLPAEPYTVTFHESDAMQKRSGADLMARGITLDKMIPGELIYLNLPLHPGSRLDKTPPTAPGNVKLQNAENMGYPGVELAWEPGSDDNWVSYYDIFRNGQWIDRVAKGAYTFDHSAGADLAANYEVCTVDGAGNSSARTSAAASTHPPTRIVDDAPNAGITYTGAWKHEKNLSPAHAGTLSTSKEAGAMVTIPFEGKRVLWFSKLGDSAGKVSISIDDGLTETVDTYSADDVWGVCVYRKELPTSGPHILKITVLGQHNPRAKGDSVAIDGFRIEIRRKDQP